MQDDDDFECMSMERLQNIFNSLRGVKQFLNDHMKPVGNIHDFSSDTFLYNTFEDEDGDKYDYSDCDEIATVFCKSNSKYKIDDVELALEIYFWYKQHNGRIFDVREEYNSLISKSNYKKKEYVSDGIFTGHLCDEMLEDILYTSPPKFQLIVCHYYLEDFNHGNDMKNMNDEYKWRMHLLSGDEIDKCSYIMLYSSNSDSDSENSSTNDDEYSDSDNEDNITEVTEYLKTNVITYVNTNNLLKNTKNEKLVERQNEATENIISFLKETGEDTILITGGKLVMKDKDGGKKYIIREYGDFM